MTKTASHYHVLAITIMKSNEIIEKIALDIN